MFSLGLANTSIAQHFSTIWTGNAYNPMSIIVQDATIEGVNMEAGDEIAVFDIGDGGAYICVGTVVLTSMVTPATPAIITTSQDEAGGNIEGFTPGNTIIFKLWDNSLSTEITTVIPTYDPQFDIVYTSLGTALVTSLVGNPVVETTASSVSTCQGVVSVPIEVENITDVTDITLIFDYGTTNLSFDGYQNANNQLSSGTLNVTENNGEVTISWNSSTAVNITSGTLMEILFTASSVYSQTIENLIWDLVNSNYENSDGNILQSVFNDGVITIDPIPFDAGSINGTNSVCQGTPGESYQVDAITNATSYVWELSPATAGTINGTGSSITIDISSTFSGTSTLSVYGSNSCGDGTSSSKTINIIANPTANAGSDATTCENEPYLLNGTAVDYESVNWTTSGDGAFDNPALLEATYNPGTNDISNGTVNLTLGATSISPCTGNNYDTMTLILSSNLEQSSLPEGPTIVDLSTTQTSEYSVQNDVNATSYIWYLDPVDAGTFEGTDNIGTVNWNVSFTGLLAYIYVDASNGCGEVSSETLTVNVNPVGISNVNDNEPNITIAPNPSNGKLNIIIDNPVEDYDLQILNYSGQIIDKQKLLNTNGKNTYTLDISSQSKGIYYLKFVAGNGIVYRKVLIK